MPFVSVSASVAQLRSTAAWASASSDDAPIPPPMIEKAEWTWRWTNSPGIPDARRPVSAPDAVQRPVERLAAHHRGRLVEQRQLKVAAGPERHGESERGQGDAAGEEAVGECVGGGGQLDVEIGGGFERRGGLDVAMIGVTGDELQAIGGDAAQPQAAPELLRLAAQLGVQLVAVVRFGAERHTGGERLAPGGRHDGPG